jgi:hypothetical protein
MTLTERVHWSDRLEGWSSWLRSGPLGRAFVQQVYGWVEYVLGWIALKRKHPFKSLDHFCKVSRRVEANSDLR